MARVVIETPCTLPAILAAGGGTGKPAEKLTKGMVLEATPALATAITSAGGTTRAVAAAVLGDVLGESFGMCSNSTS